MNELYIIMSNDMELNWYAIKTRHDFKAETVLAAECSEVYFPKEEIKINDGERRLKAVIPHVLFIKTTRSHALELEKRGRQYSPDSVPMWIYRYIKNGEIQPISQRQIDLVKLLTASDTSRCEIFTKSDFKGGEHVRVTAGIYEGYTGYVQRVRKNKHVIVRIEGICMIMLPFIHPDLLEHIPDE